MNDNDIVAVMLQALDEDSYARAFIALVSGWGKCLVRDGDYVEK
jgi:hypothetical protein